MDIVRPDGGYNPLVKIPKFFIPMGEKNYNVDVTTSGFAKGFPGKLDAKGNGIVKRSENSLEFEVTPAGAMGMLVKNNPLKVIITGNRPPDIPKMASYNPIISIIDHTGKKVSEYEAKITVNITGGIDLTNVKDEKQFVTLDTNSNTGEIELTSSYKFIFTDAQKNPTVTLKGFKMLFKPKK